MKEGLRRMEERAKQDMSGNPVPPVEHTLDLEIKVQFGGRGYKRVLMTPRQLFQSDFFGA